MGNLSLGQAAKACGRSMKAIRDAISRNEIENSVRLDDGTYEIDPEALLKRYPLQTGLPLKQNVKNEQQAVEIARLKERADTFERLYNDQMKFLTDQSARTDAVYKEKNDEIVRLRSEIAVLAAQKEEEGRKAKEAVNNASALEQRLMTAEEGKKALLKRGLLARLLNWVPALPDREEGSK